MQIWTPITLDVKVHKRVRAYLEVAPRMGNGVSELSQLLVRPALQFQFTERASLFSGYLWQSTYPENGPVVHENRLWEQILLTRKIKRLQIINRTRLEQRFFNNVSGTGHRARHMVKLDFDLYKRIYLATSNEIFVNLNTVRDGPEAGIDQDRYFAGLGFRLGNRNRIEVGYQLQYVNRSDPDDDQANHALVFQSFWGILD